MTNPTTTPYGETDYLAKAAEQLDKAAEKLDDQIRRNYLTFEARHAHRLMIADGYATLGAIQRGQLPASLARDLVDRLSTDTA